MLILKSIQHLDKLGQRVLKKKKKVFNEVLNKTPPPRGM